MTRTVSTTTMTRTVSTTTMTRTVSKAHIVPGLMSMISSD
jgi:hypothetical protein